MAHLTVTEYAGLQGSMGSAAQPLAEHALELSEESLVWAPPFSNRTQSVVVCSDVTCFVKLGGEARPPLGRLPANQDRTLAVNSKTTLSVIAADTLGELGESEFHGASAVLRMLASLADPKRLQEVGSKLEKRIEEYKGVKKGLEVARKEFEDMKAFADKRHKDADEREQRLNGIEQDLDASKERLHVQQLKLLADQGDLKSAAEKHQQEHQERIRTLDAEQTSARGMAFARLDALVKREKLVDEKEKVLQTREAALAERELEADKRLQAFESAMAGLRKSA